MYPGRPGTRATAVAAPAAREEMELLTITGGPLEIAGITHVRAEAEIVALPEPLRITLERPLAALDPAGNEQASLVPAQPDAPDGRLSVERAEVRHQIRIRPVAQIPVDHGRWAVSQGELE